MTNGDCTLGAVCDDGDACTINDQYDANCNCVGTFQDSDSDGICDADDLTNGDCTLGARCDDGDACTINDQYDADCNCVGTFQDSDSDGICDADDLTNGDCTLGTSCDNGDACTINDQYDANCNCVGTFMYQVDTITVSGIWAEQSEYAQDLIQTNGVVVMVDSIEFVAGQEIVLKEGFHATAGSYFHAYIETCTENSTEPIVVEQRSPLRSVEQSITIYPNLANELLNVKGVEDTSVIRIIDVSGRILIEAVGQQQLNVSALSKGFYFIKIEEAMLKFIKE